MIKITKENFEQVIKENKQLVIDFYADWCGPCQALGPILHKVALNHPEVQFAQVNVDEQPGLATLFQVQSIPYVIKIVDGKIANEFVGLRPESFVEEFYVK